MLVVGLMQSHLGPRVHDGGALMEGNSILYAVLKRLIKGAWLPSSDARRDLHPMAYAGWAGLLITMINLLPIGQLDGGHIATAYFGNRYGRFADAPAPAASDHGDRRLLLGAARREGRDGRRRGIRTSRRWSP